MRAAIGSVRSTPPARRHYAGVLIWRGLWREAEAELLQADRELSVTRPASSRAQAIVRLADLRRRQGRFSESAQLFAQVEGNAAALPRMAALALDVGDAERARDLARALSAPDADVRSGQRALASSRW